MKDEKTKPKRGVNVEISEESRKDLRVLAAELDMKLKDLGDEAIQLLLKHYKKKK